MLITVSDLAKSFDGMKYILDKINLGISFGDRLGVVGVNGSGKTTLLNIIAGRDKNYEGVLNIANSVRFGILDQLADFSSDETLISECKKAFGDVIYFQKKMEELEKEMENDELNEEEKNDLHMEYSHYISLIQEREGFTIDYKIEKVLSGVGFPETDFNRKLISFSGGEKRRALLAKVLLMDTNVLLLDEPTNHLDIPAIDWVIDYINNYYGAVVIISHDKRFLNKTVNKIFEIEYSKGTLYKGNFDQYIQKKEKHMERWQKEYEAQQKHIEKTEEYIRKYMEGVRTREAQGRKKHLDRLERIEKPMILNRNISVKDILKAERSGEIVASLDNADLGYNDKIIVPNVNLRIYRKDKIGIIGNNGIGKTTLIKALTGENEPLTGEAKTGYNVKYVYFTQNTSDLNLEGNLINFIEKIRPDLKEGEIRNLLARFYFTGDKVFDDSALLSGGEKTRIAILSFILQNANLLLLDEPTNHLDLFTIDSLGDMINEYPGTVLAISHDRNFIDSFAEKVILMHTKGVELLDGNFSDNNDYIMEKLSEGRISTKHFSKEYTEKNSNEKENKKNQKPRKKRKNLNVYKINELENIITEMENKVEELKNELAIPEIAMNYKKVQEIQQEIDDTEKLIGEKMEEWEEYHSV